MLKDKDLAQIKAHGLTREKVEIQIENFRRGFGCLPVEGVATVGNGIAAVDGAAADFFAQLYDKEADRLEIVKFVPASGAATRMFKELFEYADGGPLTVGVDKLVESIEKLAFYDIIKDGVEDNHARSAVEAVLAYGARLPKGLILFHKYPDGPRTAFEEHLAEGAMYACSNKRVRIHFTISPEHKAGFEELLARTKDKYETRFGVSYEVEFSQQKSSTDTIAVDPDNRPFREPDGRLLFRPAGHGALIENLDRIDADIIFIKNIDNVTPDHLKADTVLYKKVIAGMLISLQKKAFNYLNLLDAGTDDATLANIAEFVEQELCCRLPENYRSLVEDEQVAVLKRILDRPIRVCGMVRNEGEPGGGPFRVKNADGTTSLQIAEPSQIAPEQRHLLKEGTHFNPVDIVCGVKRYDGSKFELAKYTDPSTGFISEKSKDGKPLKAQELPGLWNGAMADWITVFAQVPSSTFTPVKEAADLLRPQHQ